MGGERRLGRRVGQQVERARRERSAGARAPAGLVVAGLARQHAHRVKPRAPAALEGGVEGHERPEQQRHQLVELAHRLRLGARGVDGAHLARVVQRVVEAAGGVDVREHVDEADLAAHPLEEGRRQAHVVVGVAVQPPHEGHDVDHHAARAQHAVALGQHLVRIGDVLEHGVRPDAVHGARAEGQRGGVGHDVDRMRGVDVEADELGQAVGVGELARALVSERGPRAELEVDRAGVTVSA